MRPLVTSDEREHGAAIALPVEELEVADDHAEVVEVPVQGLTEDPGRHREMTETFHPGGLPGWTLSGVHPRVAAADIERLQGLAGEFGEVVTSMGDSHSKA
ncbi:MAG: hypothetical protein V9E98_05570 [Candidatus Nanopelagicales bacterium]